MGSVAKRCGEQDKMINFALWNPKYQNSLFVWSYPVTCRTLEGFYHIDGHTFEKQYKEVLSGFRNWDQLEHADEWLLFPDNIGPSIAID